MPDKFGAAMALVKSDIGGNITVRLFFKNSSNCLLKLGTPLIRILGVYHEVAYACANTSLFIEA